MEMADKVRMLQTIYAGALADSVLRLGREGLLEKVTQQKREEQMAGGKVRAQQMGISNAEEVFTRLSDLMGCADWAIASNEEEGGFTATASRCILCAMAKRMGTQSPCHIYCLDPMEGMVKAFGQNSRFDVRSTLFEGPRCTVVVSK